MKVKIGDKVEEDVKVFTGLRDINDVDIYEDDTVLYKSRDGRCELITKVTYDKERATFELRQEGKPYRAPLYDLCSKQITEQDERGWLRTHTVYCGDVMEVIPPYMINEKDIEIFNLKSSEKFLREQNFFLHKKIEDFNKLPWYKKMFFII